MTFAARAVAQDRLLLARAHAVDFVQAEVGHPQIKLQPRRDTVLGRHLRQGDLALG